MLSILSFLTFAQLANADVAPHMSLHNAPETIEYQRWRMQPIPTRAGFLRFVGSEVVSSEWTPFYLQRFFQADDPHAVKLALLDLIARSGGNWQPTLFAHFHDESNPEIRREIVEMTRQLDIDQKYDLIQIAATDFVISLILLMYSALCATLIAPRASNILKT